MKKTAFFLTVFLFFGFVSAEELKNDSSEPQLQPENTQKTEPDTEEKECCCDVSRETSIEKPKFFYFQPLLEGRVGLLNEIGLGFDIGFHVASTDVANIYAGFSARAVTYVGDANMDLLLLPKLDFNFKLKDRYLDWIALWIGLGAEFYFMQSVIYSVDQNGHDIPIFGDDNFDINDFDVSCLPAWGIGVDLIFKNYVVLKLGVGMFALIYPELMLGLGYRF